MSDKPCWAEWFPGVLSKAQMKDLCDNGYIIGVTDQAIGYSSIDLTLSDEGYRMEKGSVKPFGGRYIHDIIKKKLAKKIHADTDGIFTLDAKKTHLFKLRESLRNLKKAKIYGQATAKSTIGRVDVLARLIVDGMDYYDSFDPKGLENGNGELYLEVTPITFKVRVKIGEPLSQLRLFRGQPDTSEIKGDELKLYECPLYNAEGDDDRSLSVDLSSTPISKKEVVAFCAKRNENHNPIDLWEVEKDREEEKPCPSKYWNFEKADDNRRLMITKNNFYILRSKERIALPGQVAVYCRAIDETIGEMRIHYAGFVHPFFGEKREDSQKGTPLIFEVRGHSVDVSLNDGEKMARLIFYRMSEKCIPESKPKKKPEREKDPYNNQELQLSNLFKDWPKNIEVDNDGNVTDATKS
jgi:dCTP deaminase